MCQALWVRGVSLESLLGILTSELLLYIMRSWLSFDCWLASPAHYQQCRNPGSLWEGLVICLSEAFGFKTSRSSGSGTCDSPQRL